MSSGGPIRYPSSCSSLSRSPGFQKHTHNHIHNITIPRVKQIQHMITKVAMPVEVGKDHQKGLPIPSSIITSPVYVMSFLGLLN